jgi:uncharacterized protein
MTSIRYPLQVDMGVGRFHTEADRSRYIRQLMIQVLLTAPGERINRPRFGCGVRQMVFAPNNPATTTMAEVLIYQALNTWVGQYIEVREINVRSRQEILEIEITYRDRETGRTDVLNQELR